MAPPTRPAVFLDRDDTIVHDVPYCSDPAQVRLVDGAARAIRRLNEAGWVTVIVTNQSGISRGYFDDAALGRVHARLRELLAKEGARVDAIYHCPHTTADGCDCRKPEPGMALRAAADLRLDLPRSIVVGDRMLDVLLAKRIGARSVLCPSERGRAELALAGPEEKPDAVVKDLVEAVDWILAQEGERTTRDAGGA